MLFCGHFFVTPAKRFPELIEDDNLQVFVCVWHGASFSSMAVADQTCTQAYLVMSAPSLCREHEHPVAQCLL